MQRVMKSVFIVKNTQTDARQQNLAVMLSKLGLFLLSMQIL